MKDALIKIIEKLSSIRAIVALEMTFTYCLIQLLLVYLVIKGFISTDVFLGVYAGFGASFGAISTFYFTRNDREKEKSNEKDS